MRLIDHGAQPGSRANAVPALRSAIEACRTTGDSVLELAPGRYDFWPFQPVTSVTGMCDEATLIPIESLNGLEICGNGAQFVFHGLVQPFTVAFCNDITFREFSIDWDVPLVAQAEVLAASADWLELRIDDRECPYVVEDGVLWFVGEGWKAAAQSPVMEYDRQTRIVAQNTGDVPCFGRGWERRYRAVEVEPGIVRFEHSFSRVPSEGSMLVMEHLGRRHAAFSVYGSRNLSWQDITIHHCGGAGVGAYHSQDLQFRRYCCVPNEGNGRFLAGDADAIHLNGIKGTVELDECRFSGIMDDPFNIHGVYVRVAERPDNRSVICQHPWQKKATWAEPGDRCGFVEQARMVTVGEGAVEGSERLADGRQRISFDDPLPDEVGPGYVLENLTWYCDVKLRNNFFGNCRARGVLISTPGQVLVEDNEFESSGCAILIPGEAKHWFESGPVRDVLIRNNRFRNPCLSAIYQFCEAIISIYPEIPEIDADAPCYHRNIRIEGNEFFPFDYPVLYAKSVDGLSYTQNTLTRSRRFEPYHPRQAGLSFEACRNVVVRGNRLEGDVLGKNIRLAQMDSDQLSVGQGEAYRID